MKKYYLKIYAFFIVAMIISLIVYFFIESTDVKSLIGNIFCGLLTGAIISLVSNLKEVCLYKNEKEIIFLQETMDSISKLMRKRAELSEAERIVILDFYEILDGICDNFKRISKIKFDELDNFLKREKIDLEIGEKIEEEIINMIDEDACFITRNEYKKYAKKFNYLIIIQRKIRNIIMKKLELVKLDNDSLKKAIM